MTLRRYTILITVLLLSAAACGRRVESDPERLSVAVSIPPQAWLVERIGGEHVEVVSILTPGDSPHTYQPTDAQITRLLQTRLFLRIGVAFEEGSWFQAVRSASRPRIVDQRAGVTLLTITGHRHEEGGEAHEHGGEYEGLDPHIWLDPARLKIQARTVAEALVESDPDPAHQADYRTNLTAVLAELDTLDARIRTLLDPLRGQTFLVFHPAWGYFAEAYGLVQAAIEVDGSEPSDAELTAVQRLAREEGIGTIFVQPQITGRAAAAVARVAGARVEILDPLARDVPENLLRAARAIAGAGR